MWCIKTIILTALLAIVAAQEKSLNVKYLTTGEKYKYESKQSSLYFRPDLRIYCYRGGEKTLAAIFQSAVIQVYIDNEDFVQYEGYTADIVNQQYENQRSIFSFNVLNSKKNKLIKIDPFNQTCVGLETAHNYTIELSLLRIDFWKVILLSIGLFIFLSAKKLSQTPLFYYLTGIFLGIFASVLVVVYFGSKLFPKKPMMYGMMVGGWTLAIYFTQMLLDNIQMILVTYQAYVFWYIVTTGFISFVICYRMGPPKNQRSKDLIKWGLQLAANVMIFYSSHFREASVGIMILSLCWNYFPTSFIRAVRGLWLRRFPPKRKLMSNEEFYEQGVRETTKALDDLKRFCSSPESRPWKMMSKLKDPQRFASFIEGSSHLQDDEILDYETSQFGLDNDLSDDDDSAPNGDNFDDHLNDEVNTISNSRRVTTGFFGDRGSMTRTSTPTNPKVNGINANAQPLYRGYNGAVEISDDDE